MEETTKEVVVTLDKFRKKPAGTATNSQTWMKPQLYRLTGYEIDEARSKPGLAPVASNRPAPITYTLYDKDTDLVAQPKWELIDRLDPLVDEGCVMIRHHANADRAYAFSLGQVDTLLSLDIPTSMLFGTPAGLFSMTHFTPARGIPHHLVIYVRTRTDLTGEELLETRECSDEYLIYRPDGSLSTNPSILYPGYADQ